MGLSLDVKENRGNQQDGNPKNIFFINIEKLLDEYDLLQPDIL